LGAEEVRRIKVLEIFERNEAQADADERKLPRPARAEGVG
jgi:hypothetical protein